MMVAQQQRQLLDSQFDRSEVIAIWPVKGFLGMRVEEPEAMEWRWRERLRRPWQSEQPASKSKKPTAIHPVNRFSEPYPTSAQTQSDDTPRRPLPLPFQRASKVR